MIIREQMELLERTYLSPFATLSENSKGRDIPEEECDIRRYFKETETGFCTVNHSDD